MRKKKNPTNEILKAAGMPAIKRPAPRADFRTAGVTPRRPVKKKIVKPIEKPVPRKPVPFKRIATRKPLGPGGVRIMSKGRVEKPVPRKPGKPTPTPIDRITIEDPKRIKMIEPIGPGGVRTTLTKRRAKVKKKVK